MNLVTDDRPRLQEVGVCDPRCLYAQVGFRVSEDILGGVIPVRLDRNVFASHLPAITTGVFDHVASGDHAVYGKVRRVLGLCASRDLTFHTWGLDNDLCTYWYRFEWS